MSLQIEALFISEQKLKTFCSINWNIDPLFLKPYILMAQDLYIQKYIGSSFYEELKTQIINANLTTPNQYVLDVYIGQATGNYALYKGLPFLHTPLSNKGLMRPTSTTGTPVDLADMVYIREEILRTAEGYIQALLNYMRERPGDYPKYMSPRTQDGDGFIPVDRGKIGTNQFVVPKKTKYINGDTWNAEYGCDSCWERNAPR